MNRIRTNRPATIAAVTTAAAVVLVGIGSPALAKDTGPDTGPLREAVTAENIVEHLEALQAIADANGGNRAAGTSGYEASAQYIEEQLRAAGYDPVRQPFSYDQFGVNSAAFEQVSPTPVIYVDGTDFITMSYSGSGDVTAAVTPVDINLSGDRASTSGCEPEDFAAFVAGSIALLQRGTCDFGTKVANAVAAGAVAAIVFNQGNEVPGDDRFGVLNGTLGTVQSTIPAVGTSFAIGESLAGVTGLTARVAVDATLTTIESFNVLADSDGRAKRTVVVGAHLDSVDEGPGINDNGTGVAAILETAIQLAETGEDPRNLVRFAFWGGEEDGLVGSDYYVSQLNKRDLRNTEVNLNFDMVGSPNFARFVYDGDGSAFGDVGPEGSDVVEQVFLEYFASQGLATVPTAFDGRSDYFGFINAGIPAGGLFTGAEGIKTEEEAALFGGTAGAPYDPCYHQACDTIANVNTVVLEEMADAIAHSTLVFGEFKHAITRLDPSQYGLMAFKADMSMK
jgi:Zn-dependent M28 family amino/carboxypeptidase